MDARERFWGVIHRTKIDRLPVLEWAPWWKDATIKRWYGEGLPADCTTNPLISAYFNQDDWRLFWLTPRGSGLPEPVHSGAPIIRDRREYEAVQAHLWNKPEKELSEIASVAADHAAGRCVVWIELDGFFWFTQRLLGIEGQMCAYYDQPDLIKDMNARLVQFNLQVLDWVEAILKPEIVVIAEDMSYNHGPMISQEFFNEFMAPYYRQVVPRIHRMGSLALTDSDGQVESLVPWLLEVGMDGMEPFERQAGVDIVRLRRNHPGMVMLGGYDKMVMPGGRDPMRREFERILPVMAQGRYFPGVDHQTPPGVSLENYKIYMELFREYAQRAVRDW